MIVENFTRLGTEEDLFLVLDNLVSAGSAVVCRRMGFQSPNPKSKKPGRPHKAREDRKVSHYRCLLSWLAQEIQRQQDGKKATKRQGHIRRVLTKVVGCLHLRNLMEARERYKSLLKIRSAKVRRQKQRKEAARLNKVYRQVGPSVLQSRAEAPSQIPTSDEVLEGNRRISRKLRSRGRGYSGMEGPAEGCRVRSRRRDC